MNLKFTKMHGTGNDFVVLDGISQNINLNNEQMRFIADRHFGIGCDQILLVQRSDDPAMDFRYRIFNADGTEVAQCGNGARCFARFVRAKGLTNKSVIRVETNTGHIILHVSNDDQVRVDLGAPRLEPRDIPINITTRSLHYQLTLDNQVFEFGAVSMGNPHAVFRVADIQKAEVGKLGPGLESHDCFPQRANIGFMQIVDRSRINLRVYERGTGETLACGSGACAAVVLGRLWGELDKKVTVSLFGGDLTIDWASEDSSVFLSGPASFVFEGSCHVPES